MKLGTAVARIFSLALHPFLIPFYSIVLLLAYTSFHDIYADNISRILFSVLLFTGIIPTTFLVLIKNLKIIPDYSLSSSRDRVLPYLMCLFSNSMLLYYFYISHMYFWFLGLVAAPIVVILIGFIINLFWKISAHMLGIGALIGSALSICYNVKGLNPFILFIILFIFAGCLGVSRLYLKKSSPKQVYIGFITGLTVSFCAVWLGIIILSTVLKYSL